MSDDLYPSIADDDDSAEEGVEHVAKQHRRASNSNARRSVNSHMSHAEKIAQSIREETPTPTPESSPTHQHQRSDSRSSVGRGRGATDASEYSRDRRGTDASEYSNSRDRRGTDASEYSRGRRGTDASEYSRDRGATATESSYRGRPDTQYTEYTSRGSSEDDRSDDDDDDDGRDRDRDRDRGRTMTRSSVGEHSRTRSGSNASRGSQRKGSTFDAPDTIPEDQTEPEPAPTPAPAPISEEPTEVVTTSVTQALLDHYASIGFYSHMKKIAEAAIANDGPNKIWIFWQAFALSKEGDQQAAINLLEPYQNDTDLGLPAVALLITAHNKSKQKDRKAMYALKKSLKTASRQTNVSSLTLAGRYFLHIGKINKARQCIEKLLSRDKKNVPLLTLFGWIYLKSGVDDYFIRSLSVFKKAASLSQDKPDVAALMGRAKFMEIEKSWDKAITDLDLLISLHPDFVPAHEEKARLLLQSGAGRDALSLAQQCITKYQSLAGQHILTLCILLLEYDTNKALYAVKQLVAALDREEVTNAELYYNTARLISRLAKRDKSIVQAAQVILKYAMKVEPRDSHFMTEMGDQHLLLGNFDEGSIVYREAYILDPDDNPDAVIGQVRAKCIKGEWEDAAIQIKDMPEKISSSEDSCLLYCRAAISWHREKSKSKASEILLDAIEKHLEHLKDEPMGDNYYIDLYPDLMCDMAKLFLTIMGDTATATGIMRDCLEYLTTGLTHLTAIVAGHVEGHLLLAKLKVLGKDLVGVEAAVVAALAVAPNHPEALELSSKVRSGSDLDNFDFDRMDSEAKVEAAAAANAGKRTPRTISAEQQRIQETKEKARRAMSELAKRSEKKKQEEEEEEDDMIDDGKDLELALDDIDDEDVEAKKKREQEADQEFQKTMRELEEKAEASRRAREVARLQKQESLSVIRETQQQQIEQKAVMVAKEALNADPAGVTRTEAIKKKQQIETMRKQREKELELYKREVETKAHERAFIPSADADTSRLRAQPTVLQPAPEVTTLIKQTSKDITIPKLQIQPIAEGVVAIERDTSPPVHEFFSDNPLQVATNRSSISMSMSTNRSPSPAPLSDHLQSRRMSEESKQMLEKKQKIMQAGQQIEIAKAFCKAAYWGELFKKHGRRGRPHDRNVTLEVDQNILKFDWSSGQLKAAKNDIQILEGKQTQVFGRSASASAPAEHCFSIVTANRSLDLEARNVKVKEYWVQGLTYLIKYLK